MVYLASSSRSGRVRFSSCGGTSPIHMPLLRLSRGHLSNFSWFRHSLHKYIVCFNFPSPGAKMSKPFVRLCAGCVVCGTRWCLLGMSSSFISSQLCMFISLAHDPHATLFSTSFPVASMNLEMMSSIFSCDGDAKKSLARSRFVVLFTLYLYIRISHCCLK